MLLDPTLPLHPFDRSRWVIAAPNGRNLLVNAESASLYRLLAGARTVEQARTAVNVQWGLQLGSDAFHKLIQAQFGGYGLLRDDCPQRPRPEPLPLRLRVEFFNPRLAGLLAAPLRWWYAPMIFWPAAVGLTLGLLATHSELSSAPIINPVVGPSLWLGLPLLYGSLLVHELGHVAACQQAGVRHGGIGFGLYYYLFPVLYADVTQIWLASRLQRVIVNLGGIFAQGLYAAALETGYQFSAFAPLRLAAGAVCIAALWQLNPFVQRDGYWLLAELTNTPNLLAKSNQVLHHSMRLSRRRGGLLAVARRVKRTKGWALLTPRVALFAYGLASASLLVVFALFILLQHGPLLLTFPLVLSVLLQKLLRGVLSPADVTSAHVVVLAFYLVVLRYAVRFFSRHLAGPAHVAGPPL